MSPQPISRTELALLTIASAVITANAYYIHPIIARVAEDFGVSASSIGLVPALNQVALALGIFLLLPLGDRFSNRRLVSIFAACQCAGIACMAFASDFVWFAAGSTFLGFFTIAPYLLPSYVSKRVDPRQLGHVTAMLTTGVIMGILLARSGAGVIGEYLGWRFVYYIAAALMLAMVFILPYIMVDEDVPADKQARVSYPALLASLGPILRQHPEILLSGTIQGLNFGLFLAIWLSLGLHLTSPAMGYGVDVVGYLAALAIINLFTTPRMGRLADKMGARRARLMFAVIQAVGMWLFYPFGGSVGLLIIPLVIMNIVGPPMDVSGRMLFLSQAPAIRTRLSALYIILMFLGGGLGSWMGTASYQWGGWTATATMAGSVTSVIVLLSLYAVKRYDTEPLFRRKRARKG
jgi:predicted MFS family arabinose efflux permease